jgi:hypothetical protein
MSKVLTVRLDDILYKRLKSQSMPTRELVTIALTEYLSKLNGKTETKVYAPYTGVNRKENKDEYRNTRWKVDQILGHLEGDNAQI